MIAPSLRPAAEFPLYSKLVATVSIGILLVFLNLWGSAESLFELSGGLTQLAAECAAQDSAAFREAVCNSAKALSRNVEQRIAVTLLLQGLTSLLILGGGGLLIYQGYRTLVRRMQKSMELWTPEARERGRDEIERLTQTISELTARQAGLEAEIRFQQRLGAEQSKRNGIALSALHHINRLLCEDDISQSALLQALRNLQTGIGAATVGLRLHRGVHDSWSAVDVLSTEGAPRLMAQSLRERDDARTVHARVVSPTEGIPVTSLIVGLSRGQTSMGTLVAEFADNIRLHDGQTELAESFARLAGLAIFTLSRSQEERRVALMEERSAIAAELHDSLAQSLAFMKLQVARLQAALESDDRGEVELAAAELGEGLSAAYQQVRELISAFRVRIGAGGLKVALQEALDEASRQSGLQIRFEDQMGRVRLEVNEEFHVLQLIREAVANAVRHAQATALQVVARYVDQHQFVVTVEDNGLGLADALPEGGHYGLNIMRERARSLNGTLTIGPNEGGGTRIELRFTPQFMHTDSQLPSGDR